MQNQIPTRHNTSEIPRSIARESSIHNPEKEQQEDLDNILLAIECVNNWAERIVNTKRSGTLSQEQEQEVEIQPEKKAADEVVIQEKEIKA